MHIERVDILFLHSQIIPDDKVGNYHGTPRHLFVETIRPVFEQLVADGRIGAWGLTAIGVPSIMLETFGESPPPAAVQCIANVLDSPGDLLRFEEPPRPRDLIAAADSRVIAVMGIRAVQAGALTDSLDRELPDDHPCVVDFRRAKPFRLLAREVGESTASLAHRYALSMAGLSTVVLGVKNRTELRECIAAESKGPLDADLVARIDGAIAEP
jgi:aryl-alcohol dehydrogenase-like predicted oxidoreductase